MDLQYALRVLTYGCVGVYAGRQTRIYGSLDRKNVSFYECNSALFTICLGYFTTHYVHSGNYIARACVHVCSACARLFRIPIFHSPPISVYCYCYCTLCEEFYKTCRVCMYKYIYTHVINLLLMPNLMTETI